MNQRIEWVDVLKGLAIICVVIGHGIIGIQDSKASSYLLFPQLINEIRNIIYSFHMPLFFIVAGAFVGHWVQLPIGEAFSKKAWRLGYPYFFWGGITACAMEFARGSINGKMGLHNYLNSWYTPFSEYWFLYILFFMFIVYYLYSQLKLSARMHAGLFLGLALFLYVVNPYIPSVWISYRMFRFTVFFAVGVFISSIYGFDQIVGNRNCLIGSFVTFVLVVSIYLWQLNLNPHGKLTYYLFLFTSILGTWLIANLAALISKAKGIIYSYLDFCGKYSMQIYCIHIFFLAGMRMVLLRTFLFSHPNQILLICILTSLIASAIFIKITQKYKILDTLCFGKNI